MMWKERKALTEQLRLMAVHAHPDDESSKGAATMAMYVEQGVDEAQADEAFCHHLPRQ